MTPQAAEERRTGQEKLASLKARLFPEETKSRRVARALEALRKAKTPSDLDPVILRSIAQEADLEGF